MPLSFSEAGVLSVALWAMRPWPCTAFRLCARSLAGPSCTSGAETCSYSLPVGRGLSMSLPGGGPSCYMWFHVSCLGPLRLIEIHGFAGLQLLPAHLRVLSALLGSCPSVASRQDRPIFRCVLCGCMHFGFLGSRRVCDAIFEDYPRAG